MLIDCAREAPKCPFPLVTRATQTNSFRELFIKQGSYHLFPVHAGDLRRLGEFRWPRVHRGHRFTRFNERCTGNAIYSRQCVPFCRLDSFILQFFQCNYILLTVFLRYCRSGKEQPTFCHWMYLDPCSKAKDR